MKIVLHAFQHKLSGVMEVPEETGQRFTLVMTQPIQFKSLDHHRGHPLMDSPLETRCVFEWTGKIYNQDGHAWDNGRIYELVSIEKL